FLPISLEATTIEKDLSVNNLTINGNEHILFVDDEDSIVNLGVRALEKYGYRVTGISDSNEAFILFKANPEEFDLVITDMAMPGIVGSELAKKIMGIRSDIPIIICSGYSEKLDKEKAKDLEVAAFLDKPLSIYDLAKVTREVLDKRKGK
ncbi:MAG: response regulator, partial [Desulfobacterales bacterium]|nr:response regulator [Desulfobacterales bacterium]